MAVKAAGAWVLTGGSWKRKGRPSKTPGVTEGAGRPTGTGYVAYEDLYVTGNTLQQVFNKVTGGKVLTFPEGEFTFSDFANGWYEGARLPASCGGVWGSGRNTIFKMVANSSTKASDTTAVPPSSGSNQCTLLGSWHSNVVWRNFQLRGTDQGHSYNGLRTVGNGSSQRISNVLVRDVFFNGCAPGYANFPPGETTSFGTNWADNVQLINCEIDGRHPDTRERCCASPFGWNNSQNAFIQDVFAHHSLAGMPTFYQVTGVHTVRLRSEYNGSGSGQLSGAGINHENVSGTVLHESPTIIIDRAAGNTGLHVSLFNGIADNPNVMLTDVTHDAGPHGTFSVAMYDTYTDPSGRSMKQVTPPTVTKSNVTLIGRNNKTDSLSGITSAAHFVHYH